MTDSARLQTSSARASAAQLDERTLRRLMWLMFGRLSLSLLSFGIAVGLDGFGPELSVAARRGLFWSVAFAFLATALSGAWFGRIKNADRFALFQIAIDVAIVTSLVHFSGGRESVFVFLYALVTVYGSLLFEKRGGMVAAGISALAYATALAASNEGWLLGFEMVGEPASKARLFGTWAVQVGALFLVGALASVLSVELYKTGRALDRSTSDLQRLRDLHQCTVESLMSGLLTTDQRGIVTTLNPEAERILGMRSAEAVGQELERVIPGAVAVVKNSERNSASVARHRGRLSYQHGSGKDLFLGLSGSVLRDVDGSAAGHIVIFQDVTRVVAMEQELRRSERLAAVGEMSAKMAHEIRNPLAAISGSIQILKNGLTGGPEGGEVARLMAIVVRETDRLSRLLGDFLQYSRPGPLVRSSIDLSDLAREVVSVLEPTLPDGVEVDLAGLRPAVVCADPDQLRQVIWNICLNAIESMAGRGTLKLVVGSGGPSVSQARGALFRNEIQASESHSRSAMADRSAPASRPRAQELPQMKWVTLVVEDTGAGMTSEVVEQIFEPFFTTKEKGSGLGLATVHRIVESHGGELELSTMVGEGTRIAIHLPSLDTRG